MADGRDTGTGTGLESRYIMGKSVDGGINHNEQCLCNLCKNKKSDLVL